MPDGAPCVKLIHAAEGCMHVKALGPAVGGGTKMKQETQTSSISLWPLTEEAKASKGLGSNPLKELIAHTYNL